VHIPSVVGGPKLDSVFPPQPSSDSEPETERVDGGVTQPRTDELLDFLQPGKEMVAASNSAEGYYDTLQALKMKNRQYLLELGLLYQDTLETCYFPSVHDLPGNQVRPNPPLNGISVCLAASAWVSTITIPQPFKMTLREAHKKPQLMKSRASLELEKQRDKRQSQEEAECQKQFRAQPVPAHVYLPLYQEIMEQNEIRREVATQKRKELLLSTQRPFSFLEKEDKKKEAIRQKILAALAPVENSKPKGNKTVPKFSYNPVLGDKLKEAELYRKIRIQMRAKDLLENSSAPIDPSNRQREPQSRIATKTKQEKLSFLQDDFSFKPRINPAVPDFERLYWAFQREAIRIREVKEPTRNQPFKLRTSNLHYRCQIAGISTSLLLSKTEDKKSRENEGIHWIEIQRKKCQAMHKSMSSRAKAMDPHKSLEETHKEKLKQNWSNDRKRTKEYKKELEEMQIRVKNRPYLFEQVTKVTIQKKEAIHTDSLV
uniref:FAM161 centrosomal protein B n=1 Tax=Terrapene triunguis TaxID=2587831 RepID=A0A674J7N2_9SAUR